MKYPASKALSVGGDASTALSSPAVKLDALCEFIGDDKHKHLLYLRKLIATAETSRHALHPSGAGANALEVAKIAHRIKSPARMLGADMFADACEALEAAGKQGRQADIECLLPQFDALLAGIRGFVLDYADPDGQT
ncbi:MAG: Hpt domain-containing protein [Candidatus Methylumidiphilus sp.]